MVVSHCVCAIQIYSLEIPGSVAGSGDALWSNIVGETLIGTLVARPNR